MWPLLWGPGWLGDILLSAGLLAAIVIAIAVLLARAEQPAGRAGAAHDWLQTVWHRYEQGDLTRWEFERLVNSRPVVQPRYETPAAAMPAGGTVTTHDAAAD